MAAGAPPSRDLRWETVLAWRMARQGLTQRVASTATSSPRRDLAGTLSVAIETFGDPGDQVRADAETEAQRLCAYSEDEELDLTWA